MLQHRGGCWVTLVNLGRVAVHLRASGSTRRPACGRLLQGTLGAKITDGMAGEEAAVEEEDELLLGCI